MEGVQTAACINNGVIHVTESYEGLEGKTITINGGDIAIVSSDDGLNAAGGADQSGFGGRGGDSFGTSGDCWVEINAGKLSVNASGDGLDSNGDMTINGGEIYVSGPTDSGNAAIDYGEGAKAVIYGGILVAAGSEGMAENFSEESTQGSMLVSTGSMEAETQISLKDSEGNSLAEYVPEKAYSCVLISCPQIQKGQTYTVSTGETEHTIEMSELLYSDVQSRMGR